MILLCVDEMSVVRIRRRREGLFFRKVFLCHLLEFNCPCLHKLKLMALNLFNYFVVQLKMLRFTSRIFFEMENGQLFMHDRSQ